jgi:hypothetical protein
MPDPTFIPGYLGTVLLNADDISAVASVVRLEKTRNLMTKPTFGSPYAHSLGGQKIGAFSGQGHVSVEQLADLDGAFNSDTPIDFSLQIGDAAGATDGGLYTGKCVLSSFTVEANADGEWDWSFDAQTSGEVIYAPSTP